MVVSVRLISPPPVTVPTQLHSPPLNAPIELKPKVEPTLPCVVTVIPFAVRLAPVPITSRPSVPSAVARIVVPPFRVSEAPLPIATRRIAALLAFDVIEPP